MPDWRKGLLILACIGSMSGCGRAEGSGGKQEIIDRSKEEAIQYIEESVQKKFLPEEVVFPDSPGGGFVFVYGRYQETDEKVSVMVRYGDDGEYEASGIGKYKKN